MKIIIYTSFLIFLININIFSIQKNNKSIIQKKGLVVIDWSKGNYIIKISNKNLNYSINQLQKKLKTIKGRHEIENELLEKAKKYLFNAILNTRVNSLYWVKDYFNNNEDFQNNFVMHVKNNMKVFPTNYLSVNKIEKIIQYPIYGKNSLSSFLLNLNDKAYDVYSSTITTKKIKTIKRFSSIIIDLRNNFNINLKLKEKLLFPPKKLFIPKHLHKKFEYNFKNKEISFKGRMKIQEKNEIIALAPQNVDYKERVIQLFLKSQQSNINIKFTPSIFPKIIDSKGKIIYSKDQINLEKNKHITYVQYIGNPSILYNIELVGVNPLVITSLKLKPGKNPTDVIISNKEVKKINMSEKKIFLLLTY